MNLILLGADLVAAAVLTFALYYRRHRRRDLVVAFLGVNVGVLAVAAVLASGDIAVGLGLGLFGVLSIIRLRSSEISQREVAYYFASLAIGLVAGLPTTDVTVPLVLMGLVLAVMWGADHPRLLSKARHQVVLLDRAILDEDAVRAELEDRLGGLLMARRPQTSTLFTYTTLVDVRYRLSRPARSVASPSDRSSGASLVEGSAR